MKVRKIEVGRRLGSEVMLAEIEIDAVEDDAATALFATVRVEISVRPSCTWGETDDEYIRRVALEAARAARDAARTKSGAK